MRIILVLVIMSAVSGCAATGPISSPQYPALLKAAVPNEAGPTEAYAPGDWFPNTVGFSDVRTTAGYGATPPVSMVFVLAANAIVIEQWDDDSHRFNVMKLLRLSDIKLAKIDTFGPSTRLVLQSSDYSFNSFDFTNGELLDKAKTQEMLKRLQSYATAQ